MNAARRTRCGRVTPFLRGGEGRGGRTHGDGAANHVPEGRADGEKHRDRRIPRHVTQPAGRPGHEDSNFNAFRRLAAVSAGDKPLKRFAAPVPGHPRLKPSANETSHDPKTISLANPANGLVPPRLCLDRPWNELDHPADDLDHPASDLDHRAGGLDHPASGLDHPASGLDHRLDDLDHRDDDLDHRDDDLDHRDDDLDHKSHDLDGVEVMRQVV